MGIFETIIWFWRIVKRAAALSAYGSEMTEEDVFELFYERQYSDRPYGFFLFIGRITVSWTRIEYWLDCCNLALIRAEKTKEKQLPKSLEAKLALFERSLSKSEFVSLALNAQTIASEIKRLREVRHDLFHGIAISLPNGVRRFERFTFGPDLAEKTRREYKLQELHSLMEEIATLAGTIRVFLDELQSHLSQKKSPNRIIEAQ